METNPNAMRTIQSNTIYTNVAETSDGGYYWEGLEGEVDTSRVDVTSWLGQPWTAGSGKPAAHPNSRWEAGGRGRGYYWEGLEGEVDTSSVDVTSWLGQPWTAGSWLRPQTPGLRSSWYCLSHPDDTVSHILTILSLTSQRYCLSHPDDTVSHPDDSDSHPDDSISHILTIPSLTSWRMWWSRLSHPDAPLSAPGSAPRHLSAPSSTPTGRVRAACPSTPSSSAAGGLKVSADRYFDPSPSHRPIECPTHVLCTVCTLFEIVT